MEQMHVLFLTSNTGGKVLETKVGHVLQNERQFFCGGWERGVMGTDEMCLLKNGLNQQFSTGGIQQVKTRNAAKHLTVQSMCVHAC